VALFTVVLDACVLYPAPLRDLLLELATADLFRARWTDRIHDEWIRSLVAHRPDLSPERLARTRELMNEAVPDCLIVSYERLVDAVTLPDEDDRHVVAAAIHARADAIVTANLRDFPAAELTGHGLEAIHPDEFLIYQFDLREADVVVAAQRCRRRLRRPPIDPARYLDTLEALALPKTVAALRPYAEIL
jgi:predicted nucleic acid-binding protein